ncbi:25303_t:CDS:2, partial [Gigaspora rosea]
LKEERLPSQAKTERTKNENAVIFDIQTLENILMERARETVKQSFSEENLYIKTKKERDEVKVTQNEEKNNTEKS